MRVRPAIPGSYEALFHGFGVPRFALVFANDARVADELRGDGCGRRTDGRDAGDVSRGPIGKAKKRVDELE